MGSLPRALPPYQTAPAGAARPSIPSPRQQMPRDAGPHVEQDAGRDGTARKRVRSFR